MFAFIKTYQIVIISMEGNQPANSDHKKMLQQLQLIAKTGNALKKWRKAADRSKNRYNRLNELVTTQFDYHADLITINTGIKAELQAAELITTQQAMAMFPNIEGMISLSDQIYVELRQILNSWNRKTTILGVPMIKFSRFLIIYSEFFKNLLETQGKLKRILETSETARQIEKKLSTPNKIVTFQSLISKPFQRPLKYHLILRDYWLKTDQDHPDYSNLKAAIECYQKVNQHNNLSVENKEKNETLMSLNAKYGGIIESEARVFVNQFSAVCLDTPVSIFLISGLVLLVQKSNDKELLRISFDKYSHVEAAGDVQLFKNRLFFYGKKLCVHLTFGDKSIRDQFCLVLKKMIQQISKNQSNREIAISQRLSDRKSLKRKFSYTNLDPQLLRPINVKILGIEKRQLVTDKIKNYYVVEFYPAQPNFQTTYTPHHVSILPEEKLTKLERLINELYPDELKCMPIYTAPRSIINQFQYRKNESKQIEIKILFVQLFLNSLFRNQQVLKRIDYIMYALGISDPIWNYLRCSNEICMCSTCLTRPHFTKYDDYYKEVLDRQDKRANLTVNKKSNKTQYCDMRTIQAHQQYSEMMPELLLKAKTEEKIAWCKSKMGKINHSLTNTKPHSKFTQDLNIKVVLRGFVLKHEYQICCSMNDRVKKIIDLIGHRREMSLEDYALVAEINQKAFILEDDEPIGNLFANEADEEGFFDKISHFFSKKEEVAIVFNIQKYWVVFSSDDYSNQADKGRRVKLNSQVESVMARIISQELMVGEEDLLQFYALFLCKKYYNEYKNFTAEKIAIKVRNREDIYVPSRLYTQSFPSQLYQKVLKIKSDQTLKTEIDLGLKILHKASNRPGWSCIMFDCMLQTGNSTPIHARIGCDLKGVKVRRHGHIEMHLQFKISDETWSYHLNGSTFVLTDKDRVYNFKGRQLWKVGQQIQFYRIFARAFIQNETFLLKQ